MEATAHARGTLAGAGQSVARPLPAMNVHADMLHEQAARFSELNSRLASALDRLTGPTPEAAGNAEKQPEPQGALMVAQFGARRISMNLETMSNLVSRLETIG